MNDPISIIIQNKTLIMAAEIGALMHDLGKLSEEFIDQMSVDRTTVSAGYNHEEIFTEKWLKNHPNFVPLSLIMAIKDEFWKAKLNVPIKEAFQAERLERIITLHHKSRSNVTLVKGIINCDRADSGVDKAIPQAQQLCNQTYISTVFGYERTGYPIDTKSLTGIRDTVCQKLAKCFQDYRNDQIDIVRLREAISNILLPIDANSGLHSTLGDTRRAANDVTLADHSFSVASIFKAKLAEILIKGEIPDLNLPIRWKLLGIKWDGLEIISKAFRVNDVLGRREMIRQVKEVLRSFIELEFPIGNKIYDDEDGIYFTVPNLEYEGIHANMANYLRDQIVEKVNNTSDGEINPSIFLLKQDTRSLVHLSWLIRCRENQESSRLGPSESNSQYPNVINLLKDQSYGPNWVKLWDSSNRPEVDACPICGVQHYDIRGKESQPFDICPVCQKRPKREGIELCAFCQHWREEGSRARDRGGTQWIDLISDNNNQVAIITGRFWLESWLHGEQTDTLFSQSIADWGKGQYSDLLKRIEKSIQGTDTSVLKEVGGDAWKFYIKNLNGNPANDANVVEQFYNAAVLERDVREQSKRAHTSFERAQWLSHFMFRKHPSPARLRRVWRTTLKFSELISNDLFEFLEPRKTWRLKLDGVFEMGKIYENAAIDDRSVELFYDGRSFHIIQSLKKAPKIGDDVHIDGCSYAISKQPEERLYKPYTSILVSPITFQFIVPADKALDIVNLIYNRYLHEMSKVRNRLPLDVGIVFFKRKTPLYVAVDAARRMLNMRRKNLDAEVWKVLDQPQVYTNKVHLVMQTPQENRIEWEVGCKLGDGKMDFYHPYFIITECDQDNPANERPTYFFVPGLGPLVHVKELCQNDCVKIIPNYFDFEFLDSCTRRYEVNYENDNNTSMSRNAKRSHLIVGKNGPRPYYLDELDSFAVLWWMLSGQGDRNLIDNSIWEGLTFTQIKGLEAILCERIALWKPEALTPEFAKAAMANTFGKVWANFSEADRNAMMRACISGQLFDVIELYIRLSGKKTVVEEKIE